MANAPTWAIDLLNRVRADSVGDFDAMARLDAARLDWRRKRARKLPYSRDEHGNRVTRRLVRGDGSELYSGDVYRKADAGSSGRAWHNYRWTGPRIVVTAGTNRADQRLVLLHEIAHILTPDNSRHDRAFWINAFTLYDRYGVRNALKHDGKDRGRSVPALRRYQREARRIAASRKAE